MASYGACFSSTDAEAAGAKRTETLAGAAAVINHPAPILFLLSFNCSFSRYVFLFSFLSFFCLFLFFHLFILFHFLFIPLFCVCSFFFSFSFFNFCLFFLSLTHLFTLSSVHSFFHFVLSCFCLFILFLTFLFYRLFISLVLL